MALVLAVAAFALILFTPGYALAFAFDLLGFRRLDPLWRCAAAIPVSIAITPVLVYWIGRAWSLNAVWGFEVAALLVFVAVGGLRALTRLPRTAIWIALIWSTVALLALADITIGNRLYVSTAIYDHYLRVAITDAITRTGIPPLNPQYFLGSGAKLRYHYFWFALCSLVDRLGFGPRAAFTASCVWAGLALMSLTALFVRTLRPLRARSLAPVAVALLAVTGLDIIPVLLRLPRHIDPDMEWWNETVYSWIGAVTWAPHYIAALVAGFAGLLFLWHAAAEQKRARWIHAAAAGCAFASCAGLNFYVAIAFAASLGVWFSIGVIRRSNRDTFPILVAGVAALVLVGPYLVSLNSDAASGSPLLNFAIRDFFPLHRLVGANTPALLRLVSQPLNFALELGFFGFVLVWKSTRGRWLDDRELALATFTAVPLLLASFFRSGHSGNNDFGNTAPLLAQFVLVIWGTDFIAIRRHLKPAWRASAAVLIGVGVISSCYELMVDRFYFPLADAGLVPPVIVDDRRMAERAYSMRSLYRELERATPRNAVFETNPNRGFDDIFFGLYAHRQMAAASMDCGTAFGGDIQKCRSVIGPLAAAFNSDPPAPVPDSLGIDVVIIADADPAFLNQQSEVTKRSTEHFRTFARAVVLH